MKSEVFGLPEVFLVFGALFVAGLAADSFGRRTRIPRVTALLLVGVLAGQSGFDLIPPEVTEWYEALSIVALTMVAFLLGGSLGGASLRQNGRAIFWVSGSVVLISMACVAGALWLLGVDPAVALILGAIATATDPAATEATLRQVRARGHFADILRGVVALDDAWGMIVFALALALAGALNGGALDPAHLLHAARDIVGALGLGLGIGLVAAPLTGRLSPGEPLQTEALCLVFLTAGAAMWLDVSYLLAGMAAGAVIVNRALHHDLAFHEIENVQGPFLTLFFILAGASLDLDGVYAIGVIGAIYVVMRIVGRFFGGWLGGALGGSHPGHSRLYGMALLPQAGVAVGMALVASRVVPEHAELILTITIATTVLFEVLGPIATMWAARRAGAGQPPEEGP